MRRAKAAPGQDNHRVVAEVVSEVADNSADYFSDVLIHPSGFREYDVRWRLANPAQINYNGLTRVGQAFGTIARRAHPRKKRPRVLVGHDFRSYSQNCKNAVVLGILSTGVDVLDAGLLVSPAFYFGQYHLDVPWGVMITASHNENGWTGMKVAHGLSQTFGPTEITRLRELTFRGEFDRGAGSYQLVGGIREAYLADLAHCVQVRRPLKVVVATGNGTAGLFTPEAFRRAGFEVFEEHTDLDWNFPHFNPNPENMAFLRSIGDAVRRHHADIGIGIDGDGDRVGIVDETGEEVFSDKAGLLIAQHLVAEAHGTGAPQPSFVVDVKCTSLFEAILQPFGARVIWEKTGHSYVKAAVRREGALAGFERSGHFFFTPPLGRGYDDATLAGLIFTSVLSGQEGPLSSWIATLPRSFQSPNMQPHCPDEAKYDVVERLRATYEDDFREGRPVGTERIRDIVTINGVRVRFNDGSWFLVRPSSNIPALVVLGESFTSRDRLHVMMDEVMSRLRRFPEVGAYDQTLPEAKHL